MVRTYPVVLEWKIASTENYFLMVGMKCSACDHKLRRNEKFWRRETQVSFLRGDDEVEIVCSRCRPIPVQRPKRRREVVFGANGATASTLIEKLKLFPPNTEVFTDGVSVGSLREVEIENDPSDGRAGTRIVLGIF